MEGQPDVTEVVVELEDLGGRTKMVMQHIGVPAGSPGEGGWKMAIDKMAGLVYAALYAPNPVTTEDADEADRLCSKLRSALK